MLGGQVSRGLRQDHRTVFTLVKVTGKNINDIADIFACHTCLGQIPQRGVILFVLHHPRKPGQVGVAYSHHDITNIFAKKYEPL